MKRQDLRPIVIKRIKKQAAGHHGGSWKIAYADFVTAMMAFFLLMWLISNVSKHELQGVAEYFRTPLKVALMGGEGSGAATSVIKGGGSDLTRDTMQQGGEDASRTRPVTLEAMKAELARQEVIRLQELKTRVERALEANPRIAPVRHQIKLDITSEGLRIQIVDDQNRPMFDSGRAEVKDWMRDILRELGGLLNGVDNKLSLSGHTDSAPYALGERAYSNWELSADRANASRRELVAGGIAEQKIVRVVGLASSVPFDKGDARNPANRRISIVVMNRKTEESIVGEGNAAQVTDAPTASEAARAVDGAQPAPQSAMQPAPQSAMQSAPQPAMQSATPSATQPATQ